MSGDQDQREHLRIEASFRVRSTALDPEGAAGDNLSKGGIFIKSTRFLPLNAVIALSIEVPEKGIAIPAVCRVAFIRDAKQAAASGKAAGMGFELLDIADDKRPLLEGLLRERRAEAPAEPSSADNDALRVIVVDDDANFRERAAAPFRKRGDTVHTTSDGLEALSLCLKEPPDVILSDVQMPRMDGWQLLRLVRARPTLSSVPVIFLTSLSGEAERLLGYRLGIDAYIPKPYDPDELLVRVHQIVRRAQNARRSPSVRSTLRGEIEHVGLPALLSFIEMERKTGTLLIVGDDVARLFFSNGSLFAAVIEGDKSNLSAKAAVMLALDYQTGQFEFASSDVVRQDELRTTVTSLLLEHARLADEKKRV